MTNGGNLGLLKGDYGNMVKVTIDSKYHRQQFDDWLAGGKIEYKGKTYYWSAQNSNNGFGWEVEPITEEDWNNVSKDEFNKITMSIEQCLYEHRTEYDLEFSPT
jgi:YHS domain-containing protein